MPAAPTRPIVEALRSGRSILSVELRPPRAELDAQAGMAAWIDTHHAVRGLVRDGTFVFLTDSAVGTREEHNLRHLVNNLGTEIPRAGVVPFLTTKHPLEYCLSYAEQAQQEGFPSLVVLGGDRAVGPPRCVAHAWELRERIRQVVPALALGGWANPHANPDQQVGYLTDPRVTADYYLTQVASHHDRERVDAFLEHADRRSLTLPAVFGVFYYRSANPRTLAVLRQFLPVPVEAITREFADGASADEICARTIRALRAAGVRHLYVSNLPNATARATLSRILQLANEGD